MLICRGTYSCTTCFPSFLLFFCCLSLIATPRPRHARKFRLLRYSASLSAFLSVLLINERPTPRKDCALMATLAHLALSRDSLRCMDPARARVRALDSRQTTTEIMTRCAASASSAEDLCMRYHCRRCSRLAPHLSGEHGAMNTSKDYRA
ncbi:hypothetical protein EDD37DRAFT_75370 [Exophiala viscosa]|uniref:uncharacterized protein n=1 Tax=Exophiala viscosa TaxID=2486360 RepID=UPI002192BE4F|nr:hypothetical protein EDD37DRAFT_75370 [Exophiala viscosa]